MEKKTGFLRFIIGYKALFGVCELAIAFSLFKHLDKTLAEAVHNIAVNLYLNTEGSFIKSTIIKAESVDSITFTGITLIFFAFGVINLTEAWGLHIRRRWAEWLTVIATGLFIPLEVYKVYEGPTFVKVLILVVNVAIVYFLAEHKELFKTRKIAEEGPQDI